MKLKDILLGTLCAVALGTFAGCKSDVNEPSVSAQPLKLSAEEVTMKEGDNVTVTIESGSGSYMTSVQKTGVVTAVIKDNQIIFHGISNGSDNFVIRDRVSGDSKTLTVNVTEVSSLMGIPSEMFLSAGLYKVLNIDGGSGEYEVSVEHPDKVSIGEVKGSKVVLKGLAIGETLLTVTDKQSGVSVSSKISVVLRPFEMAIKKAEMLYGSTLSINITSGNGTYELIDIEKPELFTYEVNEYGFSITTKGIGTTTFKVKDVLSDETQEFTLIVKGRDLRVSNESPSVPVGFASSLEITDGNGEYTVKVIEGADRLSAEIADKKFVKLTGKAIGNAKIAITDVKSGEVKEITVVVRDLIRKVTPLDGTTQITLKKGESKTLMVHVNYYSDGSWAQYISFNVDENIVSASRSLEDNWRTGDYTYTFTLTAKEAGETIFKLVHAWDPEDVFLEVPVTVTE